MRNELVHHINNTTKQRRSPLEAALAADHLPLKMCCLNTCQNICLILTRAHVVIVFKVFSPSFPFLALSFFMRSDQEEKRHKTMSMKFLRHTSNMALD